jgi:hypothetical protein
MEVIMSDVEYKYPEEDVKSALLWLQINIPKYATPEKAVLLLEYYKGHLENLEKLHPEVVEEILKDLEEH